MQIDSRTNLQANRLRIVSEEQKRRKNISRSERRQILIMTDVRADICTVREQERSMS